MMQFVLTANSPGEVATWVTPTVRALRRRAPKARIIVFIVPCAFATGAETDAVRALREVDEVYGPRTYWRIALGGKLPSGLMAPGGPGALLYLGGDFMHAVRLARRLRLPALAYVERGTSWMPSFHELLVPDADVQERVRRGRESPENIRVVGNLMVDAVQPTSERGQAMAKFGLDPQRPVLAVFPGSRPYEIVFSLPFLLRAVEIVREHIPNLQTIISLSAFADASVLRGRSVRKLQGTALRVAEARERGGWDVTTAGGVRAFAVQGAPYDVMQTADLAVTLPGSNTAEMAAAGLPMVVVLPLNLAEKVPLPGAAQYVEKLPIVGKRLKRRLVRQRAGQMRFVSWPNRKAGVHLVPEVRGDLAPDDVARAVLELFRDPTGRARMAEQLRHVIGSPGAAARVAQRLVAASGAGHTANGSTVSDRFEDGGETT